jgi:hypothetical protein
MKPTGVGVQPGSIFLTITYNQPPQQEAGLCFLYDREGIVKNNITDDQGEENSRGNYSPKWK